jgi:hypothetical protein
VDPTTDTLRARWPRPWLLAMLPALAVFLAAALPGEAAQRGRGGSGSKAPAKTSSAKKRKAPARRAPAAPVTQPTAPVAATTTDVTEATPAAVAATDADSSSPRARPGKPRVYTFGGLDLEGKLKTPQLLYFRSRMRQELDTSSPPRRSFLKELEETADAKGL